MDRATLALAVLTVLLVVPEFLGARGHHPPGFHAAVGVVSCIVVVLVSKALGKAFLQRPEEPHDD